MTYDKVTLVMNFLGGKGSAYGRTPAKEFGPLALKALQHQHVGAGHSRRYVNDQIDVIRRCFKWAVSEEMLPPASYQALQTVPGLHRGRTIARDHAPVQPVADEAVEATIAFLPPVIDDMVRLLRLLGCRPGELRDKRPREIDRSGDFWIYQPAHHKSELKGRERTIFIGAKAQAILAPYLLRGADDYCFSPAEGNARRLALLHEKRKTPLSCGNKPGSNRKRRPERKPGERYDKAALNVAIRRAADRLTPWHGKLLERRPRRQVRRMSPDRQTPDSSPAGFHTI